MVILLKEIIYIKTVTLKVACLIKVVQNMRVQLL